MNPQDAIDFSREAIMTCLKVGGPILVASLLIGMLVGVFQAMTQVQDQTVSFVPKILLLLGMIGLCLPWLTDQMLDFAKQSFEKPMMQWDGSEQASLDFDTSTQRKAQKGGLESLSIEPTFPQTEPSFPLPPNTASVSPFKNVPAMNASFERTPFPTRLDSNPQLDTVEIENTVTPPADLSTPTQTPFILPHYRFSEAPKTNIDG